MVVSERVFLAHAREDKQQVRDLYNKLKGCGFSPWLDEFDLLPGQLWKEEIPKAITSAAVVLACLSNQSVRKRGYVQREFRIALSAYADLPPNSTYLIPVRLDECEIPNLKTPDFEFALTDIQWVNLFEENGFDRLVLALEIAVGGAHKTLGQAAKVSPSTGFRSQPHNIEAEQALLGAILINNEAYHRVSGYLQAEHFYEPVHRRIYDAMIGLIKDRRPADHVTLRAAFDEDEALRELDGARYLAGLARVAETILNAEDYGRLLHDLALKRSLIDLGQEVVNRAHDPLARETAKDLVETAEQQLLELIGQDDPIRPDG